MRNSNIYLTEKPADQDLQIHQKIIMYTAKNVVITYFFQIKMLRNFTYEFTVLNFDKLLWEQ